MDAKECVGKMIETNAENALEDMKMSQSLFIIKNDKFYSSIANEYLKKLQSYDKYCKEEEKDNWDSKIENLIDSIGEVDDFYWLLAALQYETIAILLEKLDQNCS